MNCALSIFRNMILIAALIIGNSSHADAKIYIKEQVKYYTVSGKTGKQIHAKLGRGGPWRIRRKHAIAATIRSYDFKNFKVRERGKKCVLASVDVHLKLIYYYPKWINRKRASNKLQKLWVKFSRELVRHEKTHGKYFKETSRLVEKEILRASGRLSRDCRDFGDNVKKRLDKIYKKGEARHDAFDRREKKATAKIRKLERALIKSR